MLCPVGLYRSNMDGFGCRSNRFSSSFRSAYGEDMERNLPAMSDVNRPGFRDGPGWHPRWQQTVIVGNGFPEKPR